MAPLPEDGGTSVVVDGGALPAASARLSDTCLSAPVTGGARAAEMLTDIILEEDFDRNGEPWCSVQDLEHGKNSWSHP